MSKNNDDMMHKIEFYWPVTVLAKVLIVASATAVDADNVVELMVDDAVADDDGTATAKNQTNKQTTHKKNQSDYRIYREDTWV